MKYLMAIVDALIGFIQRNPFLVLLLIFLAVGAPAFFKGVALFFLGILVVFLLILLYLGWKVRNFRKEIKNKFNARNPYGNPYQNPYQNPNPDDRHTPKSDGEVHIYSTSDVPEKKVSEHVGDYVDFEETKD